ncbi:hypothetical protein C7444_11264 [Sphaerotilus hippei]|uniref:Uncharacterized protein n=1 Tax=Sphaerotilus hippei TaxID=744406 RepID=A0A318GXX1_9BURK|nr:hypothetical protein [Sphaerotilus hippei]PXW94749.1 hypothetical protein C7444_11264 [Sphaerotilus hippei]
MSATPPSGLHIVEVPTLTEVVGLPITDAQPFLPPRPDSALPELSSLSSVDPGGETWTPDSEEQIRQKVLADVQRQVDRMFEYRVRETLSPALARLTEAFIRETRDELAKTLADVVRRAVAQEMARHRIR